ncbi:MAG: iron chelate uptake ABC transporter family permease subunit [bacterium]
MDLFGFVASSVSDYTVRTVALGAGTMGVVSGVLGAFALLRRQSLLGDAISHAALPGIALAFLWTGSKEPLVLVLGAAAAGWAATLLLMSIVGNTRIKYDTSLGLVLSVFFGFGLLLLTFIQRRPEATQAGLDKFLFGQAATLLGRDVATMAVLGAVTLLVVLLLWKELKLLCFDPPFAASQGFPTRLLDVLLTSLLVVAIVLGLQTVGVVLMSAMVVAPAAAARQWTDRLGRMVLLSGLFGALAGISGAVLSSLVPRLPTGPAIVVCVSALVVISLLMAKNRGLLWSRVREVRNRRKLELEAVLTDLWTLAGQHPGQERGHTVQVLRTMALGHGGVDRSLKVLEERGLARRTAADSWTLTERGLEEARRVIQARGGRP